MRTAHLLLLVGVGTMVQVLCPKPADASPMEDTSLGGAVFTGPTSGHASSFFVNPAALGLAGRGTHYHFGASAQLNSLYIDRDVVGVDGSIASGDPASSHTPTPGGLIAWHSSSEQNEAHFGLALYTPSVQRFPANEPLLGYHSEGGQLAQGMLTLAGSYRISGRYLVGLGISIGYSSLRLKFARDSVLDGGSSTESGINSDCAGTPCGYENPQAREHYDIEVGNSFSLRNIFFSAQNISASVGVAYQLPDKSWLGLGYVYLPGAFGKLSLSGTATITRSPLEGGGQELATAEIGFRMAQMVSLGYRRAVLSEFDLVTSLRWQDWSRHDQFDIRLFSGQLNETSPEWMPRYRGMHDVWRLSGGIESNDRQRHRIGARIRLESSSGAPATANALLVPGGSATIVTGAELRVADQWVVGLGYELGWTPRSDDIGTAFDPRQAVACVDTGYAFDECGAARNGRALSTASGSYEQLRHGMVLSLRYDSL
ncbi:MAG: hypothetical protein GY811_19745 [Myxococcales bacterium]|nr:hypothetical protein [Myxococcales bacterium]